MKKVIVLLVGAILCASCSQQELASTIASKGSISLICQADTMGPLYLLFEDCNHVFTRSGYYDEECGNLSIKAYYKFLDSHSIISAKIDNITPGTYSLVLIQPFHPLIYRDSPICIKRVFIDSIIVESGKNTSIGTIDMEELGLFNTDILNSTLDFVAGWRRSPNPDEWGYAENNLIGSEIFCRFPDQSSSCLLGKDTLRVDYYAKRKFSFVEHIMPSTGRNLANSLVPVISKNGKIIGWGWEAYEKLIGNKDTPVMHER